MVSATKNKCSEYVSMNEALDQKDKAVAMAREPKKAAGHESVRRRPIRQNSPIAAAAGIEDKRPARHTGSPNGIALIRMYAKMVNSG